MRPEILVGPGRAVNDALFAELSTAAVAAPFTFVKVRDLYAHFEYSDLAAHPAIVLFPYQVSIMSIFEYYRMNLPIFAPSLSLLVQWQLEHLLIKERTWHAVHKVRLGYHSSMLHTQRAKNTISEDLTPHTYIIMSAFQSQQRN